ncbi:CCNE1 protein, partial [Vidua chalybeata]|nr:CCNE1 protein [Vidua chalybeata]
CQKSWNNIHEHAHMLIPTPDKDDDPVRVDYSRFVHLSVVPTRATPLPALGWANKDDVWKNMINKEETYVRDKFYLQRHPQLQPKMRTILLDWLMEVCEAYKLHRETFYLAQDFFDRFMATQQDVVKTLLQLIGVTSLFIAAKLEEIYPPKLHQFAYVTDGACTEDEIISMELIIMKALNWNLNPLTVVSWLNIYLQVAYLNDLYEVMLPQYPQQIFVQITELLDLCVLDIGCLEYTYGILAASALYHFSSSELMQKVSGIGIYRLKSCVLANNVLIQADKHVSCVAGYEFCEIEDCVKWMVPFAMALREVGSSKLKHFSGIAPEDLHNIQMHINSFDLLDRAQAKQAILAEQNRTSPFPTGVLTPPQSSKKLSS